MKEIRFVALHVVVVTRIDLVLMQEYATPHAIHKAQADFSLHDDNLGCQESALDVRSIRSSIII